MGVFANVFIYIHVCLLQEVRLEQYHWALSPDLAHYIHDRPVRYWGYQQAHQQPTSSDPHHIKQEPVEDSDIVWWTYCKELLLVKLFRSRLVWGWVAHKVRYQRKYMYMYLKKNNWSCHSDGNAYRNHYGSIHVHFGQSCNIRVMTSLDAKFCTQFVSVVIYM